MFPPLGYGVPMGPMFIVMTFKGPSIKDVASLKGGGEVKYMDMRGVGVKENLMLSFQETVVVL